MSDDEEYNDDDENDEDDEAEHEVDQKAKNPESMITDLLRALQLNRNDSAGKKIDTDIKKHCASWLKIGDESIKSSLRAAVEFPKTKHGDNISFDEINSIIGMTQVKQDLMEIIVYPALRPTLFRGLRSPASGILMFGPPGTGKTFIAAKVAHSTNATFFNISASTITSKYSSDTEKMVTTLFTLVRCFRPSVVFLDEVDSILSTRGGAAEGESSRRLKTQFLTEFDGVGKNNDSVLFIAATNLPYDLDSAVLRRFPKRVFVDLPIANDIARLISLDLKNGQINHELTESNINTIAEKMYHASYSNSDIKNISKEAAMIPLRELLGKTTPDDFADSSKPLEVGNLTIDHYETAMVHYHPSFHKFESGTGNLTDAYQKLVRFKDGKSD